MPKLHHVCAFDDLIPNKPRCYRIAEQDIFVVRFRDKIYALQNRCGHMSVALHEGEFTDGLIVCGLHGAAFDIETGDVEWDAILPPPMSDYQHSDNDRIRQFGKLIAGAETLPVQTFLVTMQEDQVYITLP